MAHRLTAGIGAGLNRRAFKHAAWLLAGAALIALATPTAAAAQASAAGGPATAETRAFNIPAQPLAGALNAFGRQAGLQVTVDGAVVAGAQGQAVSGRFTPDEALARLLAGTGMTWRKSDPKTVLLVKAPKADGAEVLPPVNVEGRGNSPWAPVRGYVAPRNAAGAKTDTPLIETPQSVSVITPAQMKDRNVQEESEALLYSAGVFAQPYGGPLSPYNNYYRIRGFATSFGGSFVDGLASPVNYRYEPYAYERLEVLRGPTSVLYGQSDPGGLVNRVSKRPTADTIREVEAQYGSFDRKQVSVDFGGAVDKDGKAFYRLTGLYRDADAASDFTTSLNPKDNRRFIAPALTLNISPDTSLTLLASHLADRSNLPIPYIAPGYRVTRTRVDQDKGTYFDYKDYGVGYAFEHRFTEGLSFRQNARMNTLDYDYVAMAQADSVNTPPADGRTIARSVHGFTERREDFAIDNQFVATINTGPAQHTLLAGFDYQRLEDTYAFHWSPGPSLDLLAPDYQQSFQRPETYMKQRGVSYNRGLYLQDQIKIDQRWVVTLGVRRDWSTTKTEDLMAGGVASQQDDATSYRAGINYVFANGVAPYVSYAESFLPSSGADFSGAAFEPTRGKQYEVGVKYQPPSFPGMFTFALFDLTKTNVSTPDPIHSGFSVQTGEIRARGLEFEAVAELSAGLKLTAAYTFTDAEITKSNNGDAGDVPALTPRHMASLWLDYALPTGTVEGLSLGGGVRHIGSSYAWNATRTMPERLTNDSYTLFDAAIRYDLGKASPRLEGAKLALNAANLFNTSYQTCYSRFDCAPGVPRTVIGTLSYRW